MSRLTTLLGASLLLAALVPASLQAQQSDEQKIREALSAGPPAVTENATVMDWPAEEGGEFRVLREGSNGWTCLPTPPFEDTGDIEGGPACNDAEWMSWFKAFLAGEEPEVDQVGVSYMLSAEYSVSNTDPSATEATADNEWVEGGAHMMLIAPDPATLDHYPDDPAPDGTSPGHPYVMWKGTPYVHLMIPMEEAVGDTGS